MPCGSISSWRSNADIKLDNGRTLKLVQETKYPWDGAVKMTVTPDQAAQATIHVRIPGWAHEQPMPSDLYRFADKPVAAPTLKVNGRAMPVKIDKGYVALTRTWNKGDVVELIPPMPVRRVVANDQVAADKGRVAIQRGPMVYAAEWVDNPGNKVRNLMLPDASKLTAEFRPALLNGVVVVKGRAVSLARDAQGAVVSTPQAFTAIPYYAWANRGKGEMMVWLPTSESNARPAAFPTLTTTATVTTSKPPHGGPATAVQDDEEPTASDPGTHFDWWNTRGTTEWVQYTFDKPHTVSRSKVYWFDDSGGAGDARSRRRGD